MHFITLKLHPSNGKLSRRRRNQPLHIDFLAVVYEHVVT